MVRLFQKNTLKVAWRYAANGIVWRLFYSASDAIVGECRNPDKKEASYFCVEAKTGRVKWENFRLEEPWWVGIETVDSTSIYFHHFAQPDMPQHQGIECRSLADCSLQWSNDELTFWFDEDQTICAYRDFFEERRSYSIDKRTGEVRDRIVETKQGREEKNGNVAVPLPLLFIPEMQPLIEALQKQTSEALVLESIEGIETERYFIAGYYTGSPKQQYTLHLRVFERSTFESVFSVIQDEHCVFPVSQNFFVVEDMLYFVDHQRTLCGLKLWK